MIKKLLFVSIGAMGIQAMESQIKIDSSATVKKEKSKNKKSKDKAGILDSEIRSKAIKEMVGYLSGKLCLAILNNDGAQLLSLLNTHIEDGKRSNSACTLENDRLWFYLIPYLTVCDNNIDLDEFTKIISNLNKIAASFDILKTSIKQGLHQALLCAIGRNNKEIARILIEQGHIDIAHLQLVEKGPDGKEFKCHVQNLPFFLHNDNELGIMLMKIAAQQTGDTDTLSLLAEHDKQDVQSAK